MNAGYSGTPLPKKLGLKAGQAVCFIGLPNSLTELKAAEPFALVAEGSSATGGPFDYIHAFYDQAADLSAALPNLKATVRPKGMIWISWPKKASKVPSDITENVIRREALAIGLVDVKVCAVDEVWSGLKLVIPVAARPKVG